MSDVFLQADGIVMLLSIVFPVIVIGLYEIYLARVLPSRPMDPEIRSRLDLLHARIVERSARRAIVSTS